MRGGLLSILPAELIGEIILQLRDPYALTLSCRRILHVASDPVLKARFLLVRAKGDRHRAAQRGLRYPFFDANVAAVLDAFMVHSDGRQRRGATGRGDQVSLAEARLPRAMFQRSGAVAQQRCLVRVKLYLERGGSIRRSEFAVALAAKRGWLSVIELLLAHDYQRHLSQPTSNQHDIDSPNLQPTKKRRRIETSKDVTLPKTPAELALVECAGAGRLDIVELLLHHGVAACGEALQRAIQSSNWHIMQRLVQAGAVPDIDMLDMLNSDMMDLY